jgi:hypothetical protein
MNRKKQNEISPQKYFPNFLGFVQMFGISAFIVQLMQLIRTSNNPENWDKVLVLLPLLVCSLLFFSLEKRLKPQLTYAFFATIFILLGTLAIETHSAINGVDINKILWFGFGPFVVLLTLFLTPSIFLLYSNLDSHKLLRIMVRFCAFVLVILLVPATIQGGNSLMEPDAPEYVINELLAVPAGNLPYVDFIPQYGILFTWLIAPFKGFFDPDALVTLGLYLMSAATIFAVFLGVWLVYKAMNKKSLPLAILLVVPFTSIAQFPGRESYSGSIFSNPTQIPIRLLIPLIAASSLISGIAMSNKFFIKLSFFLIGIGLWANTDFALAAMLSAFFLTFFSQRNMRLQVTSVASLVGGWLLYPIVLKFLGENAELNGFATFIKQFGGGYGSEPIQTPGPVLVILPLIVALFFASALPLYKERFKRQEIPVELKRAVLTANFFSAWSLIGFAYYLNRSYASGQMQILFLPLSIAMASYFYYVLPKLPTELPWSPKSFFALQTWRGNRGKWNIAYLPIALLMALPIATTIAFPSPSVELERLTKAPAENKWPLPKNKEAFLEFPSILSKIPTEDVGYFGSSGHYVQMIYGVRNLTRFNSPFDLLMSQNMLNEGCEFLLDVKPKYVLLNDTGVYVASLFQDQTLCDAFRASPEYPSRLFIRVE